MVEDGYGQPRNAVGRTPSPPFRPRERRASGSSASRPESPERGFQVRSVHPIGSEAVKPIGHSRSALPAGILICRR